MLSSKILAALASLRAVSAYTYEHSNVNVSRPHSNAPLNETLAYYRLGGFNGEETQLTHGFINTDCGANISVHYTDPSVWGNETGTATRPILILTHGYPESSYIWRDVSPVISTRVPVFIPDQPGYGLSTPCCNDNGCTYDKRTYANAILQAVKEIYGDSHVIYAGHDRGARTMHRAAVDNNYPGITGLGFWAADIVPFIEEYASFANPFWAQNYFHWSFLPKGNFATDVIMAYGGGAWVHQVLTYGSGLNERAIEVFKRGQAWEVYINFFNQAVTTNSSVWDYKAGAEEDYDLQLQDQKAGVKIQLPTHVMYSEYNLASAFDVAGVWGNYTDPSVELTLKGVGEKKGHFIIEEAPDEAIEQLNEFMDRLGVTY